MGTAPLASEQAINKAIRALAGFPSEQGNNREVSARASMSAKLLRPLALIGGDRSDRWMTDKTATRAQFPTRPI